jgi:hypothetical protein
MRTVTGLIVGLALGILLMYSAVSTVRVQRLKELEPAAPSPAVALPAVAEPLSLSQRLGVAAAQAACADLAAPATVLLLDGGGEPSTAQAVAGFRSSAAALPGITLVEVASTAAAVEQIGSAARLFCPDHDRLREVLEKAGDRTLPPVYTVGWSEWLLAACAGPVAPVAGVAVVDPAVAARLITPAAGVPAAPALATAALVVLTPAQFVAVFTAAAPPPVAEPAVQP